MLTGGNLRRTEDVNQVTAAIPKVPVGGRSSCGSPAFSGSRSISTSGSASSPSGWIDQAAVTTPASESDFVRRLNQLDIEEEAGSSQGTVSGKKKKRVTRAATGDKSGRGLRQFSMKVCEKVESKGTTTYNEVADELVAEFAEPNNDPASPDQQQYDEKNIRRRVYDALNVLMAMDIISKDKKEIQWKGLPRTNLNNIEELKAERASLQSRIDKKTAYLQELEDQMGLLSPWLVEEGFGECIVDEIVGNSAYIALQMNLSIKQCLQKLIQRNEQLHGIENGLLGGVALPFILVQTRPHATVEVEIAEDMQLVHFDFNSTPFELHDDTYVLKAMRFCESEENDCAFEPISNGGECSSTLVTLSPHLQHATGPTPLPGILKARSKHTP